MINYISSALCYDNNRVKFWIYYENLTGLIVLTELEKDAIRSHYRLLSQNLPQFHPRDAQRQMVAAIARTFSQTLPIGDEGEVYRRGESIVVIEGPTGVGKSLAYLLAGGILAQSRGKKLIVSSATIALQEQLINRDLPLLVKYSGLDLTFALAKGRGRYLCPYRLYRLTGTTNQGSLFVESDVSVLWDRRPKTEDVLVLRAIEKAFVERRFQGDRDDWHEEIDDKLWARVTNDRYGCLKDKCPNRLECPFFLARDTLNHVDVIVVNHDLLLSDIRLGGGVILPAPGDSFYCIDEAHHLAKKALNQFATEHALHQVIGLLERLEKVVHQAAEITDKHELANTINELSVMLREFFGEWLFHLGDEASLKPQHSGHQPIWLWEHGCIPDSLKLLTEHTASAAHQLVERMMKMDAAFRALEREQESLTQSQINIMLEWGIMIGRLEQVAAVWAGLSTETTENEQPLAKWITIIPMSNQRWDYIFCVSPISSAQLLKTGLWQQAAGAVLTSATLRSLGSFDLLLSQTGLNRLPETTTLALESPFDFTQQAELYIPPVQASPKNADLHTQEVVQWLPKLIDIKEAIGTLVLFSSKKQMHDVALKLPEEYLSYLLIQGETAKHKLLQQHHDKIDSGSPSIIFGLDSFAEGLDLPGDYCVQVIIVKLPFTMPEHPVEKTQNQWITKNGGNPFLEITVPEASIKLIQAVGRLIRTESDYGRVTILDNRIVNATYGKQLLSCLPPFQRIIN